jgi:hypothetical protein
MHTRLTMLFRLVLALAAAGGVAACAASPPPSDPHPLQEPVEALYLNYHALEEVRKELHLRAQHHLPLPGDEFRNIRSAALAVGQANRAAYGQWSLLSITEYIKDSHQRDFFTLRQRDLTLARQQTIEALETMAIYAAFVTDRDALELLERSRRLMEGHVALYDRMAGILRPLANPPASAGAVRPL